MLQSLKKAIQKRLSLQMLNFKPSSLNFKCTKRKQKHMQA